MNDNDAVELGPMPDPATPPELSTEQADAKEAALSWLTQLLGASPYAPPTPAPTATPARG